MSHATRFALASLVASNDTIEALEEIGAMIRERIALADIVRAYQLDRAADQSWQDSMPCVRVFAV